MLFANERLNFFRPLTGKYRTLIENGWIELHAARSHPHEVPVRRLDPAPGNPSVRPAGPGVARAMKGASAVDRSPI